HASLPISLTWKDRNARACKVRGRPSTKSRQRHPSPFRGDDSVEVWFHRDCCDAEKCEPGSDADGAARAGGETTQPEEGQCDGDKPHLEAGSAAANHGEDDGKRCRD